MILHTALVGLAVAVPAVFNGSGNNWNIPPTSNVIIVDPNVQPVDPETGVAPDQPSMKMGGAHDAVHALIENAQDKVGDFIENLGENMQGDLIGSLLKPEDMTVDLTETEPSVFGHIGENPNANGGLFGHNGENPNANVDLFAGIMRPEDHIPGLLDGLPELTEDEALEVGGDDTADRDEIQDEERPPRSERPERTGGMGASPEIYDSAKPSNAQPTDDEMAAARELQQQARPEGIGMMPGHNPAMVGGNPAVYGGKKENTPTILGGGPHDYVSHGETEENTPTILGGGPHDYVSHGETEENTPTILGGGPHDYLTHGETEEKPIYGAPNALGVNAGTWQYDPENQHVLGAPNALGVNAGTWQYDPENQHVLGAPNNIGGNDGTWQFDPTLQKNQPVLGAPDVVNGGNHGTFQGYPDEEPLIGGDDHDNWETQPVLGAPDVLNGGNHGTFQGYPDEEPVIGGDDHDNWDEEPLIGGGDHDKVPHGWFGGDDQDFLYPPGGNPNDPDRQPHHNYGGGDGDPDRMPHTQGSSSSEDTKKEHDYELDVFFEKYYPASKNEPTEEQKEKWAMEKSTVAILVLSVLLLLTCSYKCRQYRVQSNRYRRAALTSPSYLEEIRSNAFSINPEHYEAHHEGGTWAKLEVASPNNGDKETVVNVI